MFGKLIKQRSTWAGVGILAAVFGAPPEVVAKVGEIGQVVSIMLGTALMAFDSSKN